MCYIFCFLTLRHKSPLILTYWLLLSHFYKVGRAANHQSTADMENYEHRPLDKPVTAVMSQHTWKCTTKSDIVWLNWVAEWTKSITCKTKYFCQLPFHIRPYPLKLPRVHLKDVAWSPRDLLKILANWSPALSVFCSLLVVPPMCPAKSSVLWYCVGCCWKHSLHFRSEALNTSSDEESLTYLIRNKLRGKAIGQS